MSNYTTEVRFICESYAGLTESSGYDEINNIIHQVHNRVMGDYPIFDEAYREILNRKIIRHYYVREICEETVGLWKLKLNNRMNEIMPYYNKLYESELLKFNPFYDVDLVNSRIKNNEIEENMTGKDSSYRSENRVNDGISERDYTGNSLRNDNKASNVDVESNKNKDVNSNNTNETISNVIGNSQSNDSKKQSDRYSDTPQGSLQNIENDTYLTNARIIDGDESNEQSSEQISNANGRSVYQEDGNETESTNRSEQEMYNSDEKESVSENNNSVTNEIVSENKGSERKDEKTISNIEDYIEHVQGKRGGTSYAKLLKEFRDTFLNIDNMIINDLKDLFFALYF